MADDFWGFDGASRIPLPNTNERYIESPKGRYLERFENFVLAAHLMIASRLSKDCLESQNTHFAEDSSRGPELPKFHAEANNIMKNDFWGFDPDLSRCLFSTKKG